MNAKNYIFSVERNWKITEVIGFHLSYFISMEIPFNIELISYEILVFDIFSRSSEIVRHKEFLYSEPQRLAKLTALVYIAEAYYLYSFNDHANNHSSPTIRRSKWRAYFVFMGGNWTTDQGSCVEWRNLRGDRYGMTSWYANIAYWVCYCCWVDWLLRMARFMHLVVMPLSPGHRSSHRVLIQSTFMIHLLINSRKLDACMWNVSTWETHLGYGYCLRHQTYISIILSSIIFIHAVQSICRAVDVHNGAI